MLDENGKCALTSDAVGRGADLSAVARALRAAGHPQRRFGRHARALPQRLARASNSGRRWSSRRCRNRSSTGISWSAIAPDGKTPIGTYGGWNLAVYQSSQHKDAAWKFVQFLTREDVNGAVVDLIPANVKAAKAFLEANRKGADRIMTHLENAAPRPLSPRYLEVSDIEVTLAQDVYSGTDPKAAARKGLRGHRRPELRLGRSPLRTRLRVAVPDDPAVSLDRCPEMMPIAIAG